MIKNHNFVHVDPVFLYNLFTLIEEKCCVSEVTLWRDLICEEVFTQNIHIIYVHFSAELKLDDPVSVSVDLLHLKKRILRITFLAVAFNRCVCLSPLQIMWKFRSQLYRDICHRHELYKCKCNLPVLLEILIVCSCTPIFGIKAVFASKSALTGDHSLTKAYHLTISGAEENRSMSTLDDCALIQRLD